MRSRSMWLAALGGGAALGLWLWTSRPRGDAPEEVRAEAESEGRREAGLQSTLAPPAVRESADPSGVSGRRPLEPVAVPEPVCHIRVLRADSMAPEPGATLWLQRAEVEWTSPDWKALMARFNDVEPVLAAGLGEAFALDERGQASVPVPARRLSLAAVHGEWHGEATLEPGQRECVVELTRQHSLEVEVVDGAGRPVADAFVVLGWGAFDPIEQRRPWKTDAQGRLSIVKLENQIWPAGYAGPLRLSVGGGASAEPAGVEFTLDDVPVSPVRFVLGAHGSLRVQLVDREGLDLDLEGQVDLWQSLTALREPTLSDRAGADLYAPLVAGSARFGGIGPGHFFEISVQARGHVGVWDEALGPTRAGEECLVRVPVGDAQVTVRGRVSGLAAHVAGRRPPGMRLTGHHSENGLFQAWVEEDEPFEVAL